MKTNKKNTEHTAETIAVALKTQVKNEAKKNETKSFAELMNIGKTTNNIGGRRTNSIYVDSLYSDLTLNEERKKRRKQIRAKLERDFLASFLVVEKANDSSRMKQLAKNWFDYAPNIYRNPTIIYDGNDANQKALCQRFVEAMQKVINK